MFLRVLLFLALTLPASAATEKIPRGESTASIRLPNNWKTVVEGEITQAISADGRLHFLVVKIEHSKAAEAMGEVMYYIRNRQRIAVAADTMRSSKGQLNGRETHLVSWEGTDHNDKVEIHFTLFSVGPNNGWLAAYWGSPAIVKKYQPTIDGMIKSVKPIAPDKD